MSDETSRVGQVGDSPTRGRGRPRVAEPGAGVSTWLSASQYDKLIRIAQAQDKTVSSLVREVLILRLK